MPQNRKRSLNSSALEEQKWKIGLSIGTSAANLIKSISIKEEKTYSPEVASQELRFRELGLVLHKLTEAMRSEETDQADLEALFAQFINLDRTLFLQFLHGFISSEETVGLSDAELIKLLPAKMYSSHLAGDSSTDAPPPKKKKKGK